MNYVLMKHAEIVNLQRNLEGTPLPSIKVHMLSDEANEHPVPPGAQKDTQPLLAVSNA